MAANESVIKGKDLVDRSAPLSSGQLAKEMLEEPLRIRPQRARDFDEFDDIDAPLARFDSPHKGVGPLEGGGELALCELRSPAGAHQYRNNAPVTGPPKGLS